MTTMLRKTPFTLHSHEDDNATTSDNELEKPKKLRKPRKKMSEAQKEALRRGREKAKLNQQRRMLK